MSILLTAIFISFHCRMFVLDLGWFSSFVGSDCSILECIILLLSFASVSYLYGNLCSCCSSLSDVCPISLVFSLRIGFHSPFTRFFLHFRSFFTHFCLVFLSWKSSLKISGLSSYLNGQITTCLIHAIFSPSHPSTSNGKSNKIPYTLIRPLATANLHRPPKCGQEQRNKANFPVFP